MNEDEGLTLALSPVQIAAIVRRNTISEGETLSNRLWGGLGVVSGVAEIFGAGVLCIVPEPTMITKAGCVVVGAHSLDTLNASLKQVWTGRKTETATAQLIEMAAGELAADPATAYKVAVAVDLAVPFIFASAAGAARVGTVYSGRIRLMDHEGGTLGHTIARHVGQTDEQMIARLVAPRAPSRASTFYNIKHAELLISEALSVKSHQIESALKYMQPGSRLGLDHRFHIPVGRYIDKGTTVVKKAYALRIIIEAMQFGDKTYYLVTAYPVP
ncbi:MAG: RNase A-like domain-containing protein [Pantoea sp.]|uniref:RNase A-like domain-containing protein n=2 Tax=Pantoea septica TaxID=472695 RepID=UPI000E9C31F0|nr:RNase A-like domain-containing protein [Pantoea septica]MBU5376633.1 hypothetical protein [Pantoea septica]MDU5836581.1 RNase A-like domain-containing protein [Pantoea sp.]MDU6441038.1 RNase A-like domain-containing protein [Pantoea sp.]HAT23722.1 hypothetical protein [Pantoea septica]